MPSYCSPCEYSVWTKARRCRRLSFKQVADIASSRRVKIPPVDIAMVAMHPALIPVLSSGSDALKAATLTCVVAAMLTGILLRHFRSFVCRWLSNIPAPRFGPCSSARCPALHNAARQGDAGGVKALLAAGSDVHSTDPSGYSLRSRLLSRRFRCLGFADCRRGIGMCLLCRRTALHCASVSQNGHTEIAMALVKAGADVHCKDKYGYGSALGLHPRVVGSP